MCKITLSELGRTIFESKTFSLINAILHSLLGQKQVCMINHIPHQAYRTNGGWILKFAYIKFQKRVF